MTVTIARFTRADEVEHGIQGSFEEREVAWYARLSEPVPDEDSDEGDSLVRTHARTNTPLEWDGLPRTDIRLQQITPIDFLVSVTYSTSESQASGAGGEDPGFPVTTWEFEYSVDVERIYVARNQLKFGANAPNHQKYINVVNDAGRLIVEGADSFAIRRIYRLRKTFPYTAFTTSYINAIEDCVGTLNDATFKGVPAKELLFLGARGSIASTGESELSFEFQRRRPPALPMTIGGIEIPAESSPGNPTDISGWDIIWSQNRPIVDGAVNDLQAGAVGVYVARHLRLTDFDTLNL